MASHAAFCMATSVEVFFAHPHSPWERSTNENTNGLIREYFPKGTEITDDQTYLDRVAAQLNNRPRRILRYRTSRSLCRPPWPARLLPPADTAVSAHSGELTPTVFTGRYQCCLRRCWSGGPRRGSGDGRGY
jgi:hypothetical protein